jgi:hypothetical protein
MVRIITGDLGQLVGPGVDDGMPVGVVDAGDDALLEFVLGMTWMWRTTERANLEKKPSMRLSQRVSAGVALRPRGKSAGLASAYDGGLPAQAAGQFLRHLHRVVP